MILAGLEALAQARGIDVDADRIGRERLGIEEFACLLDRVVIVYL